MAKKGKGKANEGSAQAIDIGMSANDRAAIATGLARVFQWQQRLKKPTRKALFATSMIRIALPAAADFFASEYLLILLIRRVCILQPAFFIFPAQTDCL